MSDSGNKVEIIRVFKAPPERVFKALSDPMAVVRWQPPFGFLGRVDHWDFRVGGQYKMAFINFSNGQAHSFGGSYLEIITNEKIVVTDSFDNPDLPGTMRTTTTLKPALNGTFASFVQENIPAAIRLEFCYAGWHESMLQLAQLVEPCIPEGSADA